MGEDVTDEVIIDEYIDTKQSGTYEIVYTYKTEKGKEFEVKRIDSVLSCKKYYFLIK